RHARYVAPICRIAIEQRLAGAGLTSGTSLRISHPRLELRSASKRHSSQIPECRSWPHRVIVVASHSPSIRPLTQQDTIVTMTSSNSRKGRLGFPHGVHLKAQNCCRLSASEQGLLM